MSNGLRKVMSKWHIIGPNDNGQMAHYRFKQFCLGVFFGLTIILSAFLFSPSAFSRTKVQTGEVSDVTADSATVSIEKVDVDKSIILLEWRTDEGANDNDPDNLSWAAKFTNITTEDGKKVSNQIYIKRRTSGSRQNIRWFVVESDAFQVEYIETHIDADQLTKTIDLTNLTANGQAVDFVEGKSFAVALATNFEQADDDAYNASLFTTELVYNDSPTHDQLVFTRQTANSHTTTDPCDIWAFVVKMRDDSNVYQGSATLDETMLLATADIKDAQGTPVAVDRSKSFMLFDKNTNYSSLQSELRGAITSDTQVGFNRRVAAADNPGDANVYWYVIEFGTLGRADSGEILLPKGPNGTTDPAYCQYEHTLGQPVDVNLAFAVCSQDSTGGGQALYRIHRTVEFIENGTKLLFHRGEGGQHAVVDFLVGELEPMRLFSPNGGGEPLVAGETYDITWYAPESIQNVELLLSNDGGSTYPVQITSSTPNDGVYEWTIPSTSGIIGNQMRVKVRDTEWNEFGRTDDTYSSDVSDADFEIIGKIVVTYPNGGENIIFGDATDITWNFYGDAGSRTVAIKYSDNGGSSYDHTLATGVAIDAGTYTVDWASNPLPISNVLKVKVEQEGEETRVYDESDNTFTVKGKITVSAPNGSETWNIGETNNITWAAQGSAYMTNGVNIFVSRNLGGSWDTVVNGVGADSSPYSWQVEAPGSTDCYVKVVSVD
ncbi:MAG: hypothetical protein DRP85_09520, partial [Candidatus Makaraimicrobium thalassicum]